MLTLESSEAGPASRIYQVTAHLLFEETRQLDQANMIYAMRQPWL